MTRTVVGALLVAAVAAGLLLAGMEVVRERRYQQFLENGDRALASDQAFAAIEAYSGAIALKDDSMIAFLKRGEAYRRRGELGGRACVTCAVGDPAGPPGCPAGGGPRRRQLRARPVRPGHGGVPGRGRDR